MENNALIVEDDEELAAMLQQRIRELGFLPERCSLGEAAAAKAAQKDYAFMLLDLTLPDIDGIEVLKLVRRNNKKLPIIILTARQSEDSLVSGLQEGADEYIRKPVDQLELKARINAVLRRVRLQETHRCSKPIQAGELEIDLGKRLVLHRGAPVALTAREFDILAHLAMSPGRVFSRDEINAAVFGTEVTGYEQTVSVHINHIRSKIEPVPSQPRYLLTVRGVGYAFCEIPPERTTV